MSGVPRDGRTASGFRPTSGFVLHWSIFERVRAGTGWPRPRVKTQRVVTPAQLVKSGTYLETSDEVRDFLDALRRELERAITNKERIQIR